MNWLKKELWRHAKRQSLDSPFAFFQLLRCREQRKARYHAISVKSVGATAWPGFTIWHKTGIFKG
jgi:hypothetical protein